jgi:uncharacterized membrane protein
VILHVSPGSPWWAFAAADLVLSLHIAGGSVGLVSGAVALLSRKGERLHRLAGTVFLVSMLIMAAIGASASPFLPVPQPGNLLVGTLTFYLVATSWITIRRKDGGIRRFEIGGFFVALIIAAGATFLALKAASSPKHTLGGQPMQVFLIFALAAAMCAAFDLKVILKGGITGAPRIARHLWRMCLALTSASVSFFLGQQKFFPAALHGSPLLFVPVLAPLVLMVFWLIRVRLTNWFKNGPVAA